MHVISFVVGSFELSKPWDYFSEPHYIASVQTHAVHDDSLQCVLSTRRRMAEQASVSLQFEWPRMVAAQLSTFAIHRAAASWATK